MTPSQKNEKALAALREFGVHKLSCNTRRQDWNSGVPGPCDCGLDQAIATLSQPTTGDRLTEESFWKLAILLGNSAIAGKLRRSSTTFKYVWSCVESTMERKQ